MAQALELGAPLVPADRERAAEPGDLEACDPSAPSSRAGPQPLQGSCLHRALLTWVFPLLQRSASTEQLALSDVFGLEPKAFPEPLNREFMAAWRRETERRRTLRAPPREGRSLLRVLLNVHFHDMKILWLVCCLEVVVDFAYPVLLNLLLRFAKDESVPRALGLLYALTLSASQGFQVVLENNVRLGLQSLAIRIHCTLVTCIFRKVMLLRQDSLQRFSSGTLNNMITTDAEKVTKVLRRVHVLLISGPLRILVSLVGLNQLMGVAVWISFSWMALVIMLNPVLMWIINKLQARLSSDTDERIRRTTEVVSAIQVIKCYAWEEPATAKVEASRRRQLNSLFRCYGTHIIVDGLWTSIVPMTTCIMVASYAMLYPDVPLTAATAFTAISLLAMLGGPLFDVPYVLNLIVEALVSSRRLERLFFLPEVCLPSVAGLASFCDTQQENVGQPSSSGRPGGPDSTGDPAVEQLDDGAAIGFEGASFVWPRTARPDDEEEQREDAAQPPADEGTPTGGDGEEAEAPAGEFRLVDLSLRVQKGALVAVVGATASGKTSLLHAVLGEMPAAPGAEGGRALVRRHRPIAFAPQQAWIINDTVRQNILLGEAYVEQHYAECLRCCDLEKDLALLKDGDQTKVGERGIALSGGQRARVCLARVAYRQSASGLFLLDDPYSALDAHVARKIHEEAVQGLLAKKTRVVATNRLEFVSSCDTVIVLEGGRVEALGKYEEVRRSSAVLRGLMAAQGLEAAEDGDASGDGAQPPPALDFNRQLGRALSYDSAASDEEQRCAGGDPGQAAGQLAHQEADRPDEGEENEEARESGSLKKEVVFYYLRNMGTPLSLSALAAMYVLAEGCQLALPVYLAHWTTSSQERDRLWSYVGPAVALSIATVVMFTGRDMMGNLYGFRAARRLYSAMFAAMLRAPMSFFQDTPQGRIINRFSKDTYEIDQDLVWNVLYTVVPLIQIIGNFGMVGLTSVFSLVLFAPMMWLYSKLWKYYNKAALDMKRLSKVMSSPVYDHFSNLCRENGISTVRALCQVENQCRINNGRVVDQQRTEYSQLYMELWFSMRMSHLGCALVLSVALCVVVGRGTFISASSAALALNFSNQCSESVADMIGMLAEFGMAFNCVERIKEYCMSLPAEAPLLTEHRPPENWPSAGELEVRDLRLRYRPHLPLVLKGLTFRVAPGERLGVCGRTGAGKSSLLLALLRIAEPEPGSTLRLDGQDLMTLGLRDVRRNIAMIPQDPVLFQESLRYNCDPFGEHGTDTVWEAIEEAQLAPWVRERALGSASTTSSFRSSSSGSGGGSVAAAAGAGTGTAEPEDKEAMLAMEIKEGGQNLSAGQRQMVAIARAVLRRARLVVLDEATAAVDASTDAAIQLAVRRCFMGASTLTIAHRLRTIADSDRVLVLAEGSVAELGPPAELLQIEGGVFRGLTEEAEK